MRTRSVVLALLVLLSVITYMDRVCISVAAESIQSDLKISNAHWGWVLGSFSLAYGLFEIPSGLWGDRHGQRRVLGRIVLWWSAFTALTGLMRGFWGLLAVRFLFGAGEAGAYPNAAGCVGRWFPSGEHARAQGWIWAASRLGGALTPVLVVPLMALLGWRYVFALFGAVGAVWAVVWIFWFRDRPAEHPAVSPAELRELPASPPRQHTAVPWGRLLMSGQFWLLLGMYWCYVWGSMFFLSWFHKYLTVGRGLETGQMAWLSSLPFLMGAAGNFLGGGLSDRLVARHGRRVGRVWLGSSCLAIAGLLMLTTALVPGKLAAVLLLAAAFGVMDCMLPCAWAICLDIGQSHAGTISGAMNSAGQAGGTVCIILFGYLIQWYGNYDLPLIVIAVMVLIAAVLFAWLDPTRPLLAPAADSLAGKEPACA